MKKYLLLLVSLMLLCVSLEAQLPDSAKFRTVIADDFLTLLRYDRNAVLIDVRTKSEYKKERIEEAVNIPYPGSIKKKGKEIQLDRTLLLYCTSGTRSDWAAAKFYDLGFRKIYSLKGGINEWKRRGLPVQHEKKNGQKSLPH